MARVSAERVEQSKRDLLEAARKVLTAEGFAGLSTRRVAEAANTQMSQIQYHFGSKEGMILALFEHINAGLLDRQTTTFNDPELSLSQKWFLACDYLEDDLTSGYVAVLQELIAAGWSKPRIREPVRIALDDWQGVLGTLATQAERDFGSLGPFKADGLATLISSVFLGAESLILLGDEERFRSVRDALRQFGNLIAMLEDHNEKE